MTGLRVVGDERALGLAGVGGEAPPDAPTVHLGPPGGPADIVWLSGPAAGPSGASRLIATGGDGLWSRAPWPARDELFELAPAPRPLALVVGEPSDARDDVVAKLTGRGLPTAHADALTAAGLEEATVVLLLGAADAASDVEPLRAAAMPAEAPAVLAARRVLVAPRCGATFGLLPGTDHLACSTTDDAVQYTDAVLTFPESFEPFRVLGAAGAEPHRASRVYERIARALAAGL